ncbi:pantothenate kinase [Alkalinema sp. FACHB-956]|uniref:pantothenate kinase n=1 Tax=Alkalinema sp. FACHB-956 TaxID=2692768 RepID=UPI0016829FE4|nr:pantothenate kinase [Alkalinema sp. FACHB-956]
MSQVFEQLAIENPDRRAWLALAIGNSRLHWAWFQAGELQQVWDTSHLNLQEIQHLVSHGFNFQEWAGQIDLDVSPSIQSSISDSADQNNLELWLTSVVPQQTDDWQKCYPIYSIERSQIPIPGLYSTLGIDRIVALWAAMEIYGSPVLVIDGGTALTLTGATVDRTFAGGAILPGLQLQFRSLGQSTAALPKLDAVQAALPTRWAHNTPDAIQSGILYTVLAGLESAIQDWDRQHSTQGNCATQSHCAICLTGGDGAVLANLLQQRNPHWHDRLHYDRALIFRGMQLLRDRRSGMR